MKREYIADVLGIDFFKTGISLRDDYTGQASATLVRKLSKVKTAKAILYIHGFNDYFFQKTMADWFNEIGFNFYALDLRRYGRSYQSGQPFNDIRNLKSYFEEIETALRIIREEGNTETILMGHSTGGLIVTVYAKDNPSGSLYDGIILNSPFFDFNLNKISKFFIPFLSFLGRFIPVLKISGGFSEKYGESLHEDYDGEWDYYLPWKPNIPPKVNLGWLRAIHLGHKKLGEKFELNKPILLMHSSHSSWNSDDLQTVKSSDIILNIGDIVRVSKNIIGEVETVAIENGIHDLVLSPMPVRGTVYKTIGDWLVKNKL